MKIRVIALVCASSLLSAPMISLAEESAPAQQPAAATEKKATKKKGMCKECQKSKKDCDCHRGEHHDKKEEHKE